jgi:hypothetical protein
MYNEAAEERSQSNQSNPSQMKNDGFAELLYSNRQVNDKIFADIIKQNAQNHAIQQ